MEKLGLALMDRTMLSKYLIQFSVDGRGCIPALLFYLKPSYYESNGDLLHMAKTTQYYKLISLQLK